MTETGFYILFCLQKENHGYRITQKVKEMTDSQVSISPGTMYGTLSKMEKDGLISFVREEEKRKIYQITDLEFTEEHLTDLDPGEPTICVTATVTVKDWEIVPVEPEYGK